MVYWYNWYINIEIDNNKIIIGIIDNIHVNNKGWIVC
jgi:hypothetical protein